MRTFVMRAFVLAAVMAFLPFPAAGQSYAVLSLVGDQLLVVRRQLTTGTHLDRNDRTFLRVREHAIDREVLLALEHEIKRLEPGASVSFVAARDPDLYDLNKRFIDDAAALQSLLPVVRQVTGGDATARLVLVVKHRAEARVKVVSGHIGAGRLEGVGFYLDHSRKMVRLETGEQSEGFIAPFAYFRLALIDLGTGAVLSEAAVEAARPIARQGAAAPWEILSEEEKGRYLRALIRAEVRRSLPQLFGR